jgi:acyl carrier protein
MSNNMFMPEKDIQLSSKLVEDLGMEELDIVEVVIDIEQRFNIEVDDDDIDDLITFQDLMNYVTKALSKEVTNGQRILQEVPS